MPRTPVLRPTKSGELSGYPDWVILIPNLIDDLGSEKVQVRHITVPSLIS